MRDLGFTAEAEPTQVCLGQERVQGTRRHPGWCPAVGLGEADRRRIEFHFQHGKFDVLMGHSVKMQRGSGMEVFGALARDQGTNPVLFQDASHNHLRDTDAIHLPRLPRT